MMALSSYSGGSRGARVAMAATLLALGCLALTAIHETASRRTVLMAGAELDPAHNPFAGTGRGGFSVEDPEVGSDYDLENPDVPGRQGSWSWATSVNEDGDIVNGHGNDWIYQGGPAGVPLKGSSSYYYNQWAEPEWGPDGSTEYSNADHSTSHPYSAAASRGTLDGPMATDNILNTDDYIRNSNGIY